MTFKQTFLAFLAGIVLGTLFGAGVTHLADKYYARQALARAGLIQLDGKEFGDDTAIQFLNLVGLDGK